MQRQFSILHSVSNINFLSAHKCLPWFQIREVLHLLVLFYLWNPNQPYINISNHCHLQEIIEFFSLCIIFHCTQWPLNHVELLILKFGKYVLHNFHQCFVFSLSPEMCWFQWTYLKSSRAMSQGNDSWKMLITEFLLQSSHSTATLSISNLAKAKYLYKKCIVLPFCGKGAPICRTVHGVSGDHVKLPIEQYCR